MLTDFQQSILHYLTEITLSLHHRQNEAEYPARIYIASGYAFALFHDLDAEGTKFPSITLQP